jgi:hypothetical protein
MRSRIAIFEGYGRSLSSYGRPPPRRRRGYGGPLLSNPRGPMYGGPLLSNPRGPTYGGPLLANPRGPTYGNLGRRSYRVDPVFGPASTSSGRPLRRKGYKVKKGRNSRWQVKFKKAAKSCKRRRNRGQSFQSCMKKKLGKKKR